MGDKIEIRLFYNPARRQFEVFIFQGDKVGRVTFGKMEIGTPTPPTLEVFNGDFQALANDLWREGFRPADAMGSAGELAATRRHLEDFRTIVFNKAKIGVPG